MSNVLHKIQESFPDIKSITVIEQPTVKHQKYDGDVYIDSPHIENVRSTGNLFIRVKEGYHSSNTFSEKNLVFLVDPTVEFHISQLKSGGCFENIGCDTIIEDTPEVTSIKTINGKTRFSNLVLPSSSK